ncbi:hypothetical protein [Stenotrophomonas sp.]|uniref:hypothetical protein n=1 Tax=Stenotrophomonas sp. TaxID=69392 RepID=UPI0031D1F1C3
MDRQQVLQRVVENALDFLTKSINDLNSSPKHSVIGFYTGVELFLKARLLAEHWTLVVSKAQDADASAFLRGDFSSVTLKEAATKLEKVLGSGLSASELQTFINVGNHRNKMIHFFHEEGGELEREQVRTRILMLQMTAWHQLNILLTRQWGDVFAPWQREISSIQRKLRGHRKYLKAAYKHARPAITEAKATGCIIETCPACKYKAEIHLDLKDYPYETTCPVCELAQHALRIDCPNCETEILFRQDGHAACSGCEMTIEPTDLAELLDDAGARHLAALEGEFSELGNCTGCDGHHLIATTEGGQHICAGCLTAFEELSFCEFCGDSNSGDMTESYLKGCNHCEGRSGLYRDD